MITDWNDTETGVWICSVDMFNQIYLTAKLLKMEKSTKKLKLLV